MRDAVDMREAQDDEGEPVMTACRRGGTVLPIQVWELLECFRCSVCNEFLRQCRKH